MPQVETRSGRPSPVTVKASSRPYGGVRHAIAVSTRFHIQIVSLAMRRQPKTILFNLRATA